MTTRQNAPAHVWSKVLAMQKKLFPALLLMLTGCVSVPDGVRPVNDFQLERYLGRWYEIARLDHSFERGASRVTADYSLRDDGSVRVLNRGYLADKQLWKEAEGRAYLAGEAGQGLLKVSFFGPFYGSYVIVELDHASYQYALVCGPDRAYLWILARSPHLPAEVLDRLVARAASLGFATDQLLFVEHP